MPLIVSIDRSLESSFSSGSVADCLSQIAVKSPIKSSIAATPVRQELVTANCCGANLRRTEDRFGGMLQVGRDLIFHWLWQLPHIVQTVQ
jgi:hypothetical protein